MIKIELPGEEPLEIANLVLDFNGTIATDGVLIEGVAERLQKIAATGVRIHLITADSNGSARRQCEQLPLAVEIREGAGVAGHKKRLVQSLGARATAAVGNGRNDLAMLEESGLAIAVAGAEGCYGKNFAAADIVVTNILDALDLLIHPHRLLATLRS